MPLTWKALDIHLYRKGLLRPRFALTPNTTLGAPLDGVPAPLLLVSKIETQLCGYPKGIQLAQDRARIQTPGLNATQPLYLLRRKI